MIPRSFAGANDAGVGEDREAEGKLKYAVGGGGGLIYVGCRDNTLVCINLSSPQGVSKRQIDQ